MREPLPIGCRAIASIADRAPPWSAASLVLAAAVLFGLFARLFGGIEWIALHVPLELVEGRSAGGSFRADWGALYEIRVDTERELGVQEQSCLLGIETVAPERCAAMPSELLVSWTVKAGGEPLSEGSSEHSVVGYRGPTMGKVIGYFETRKDALHEVSLAVRRSSPRLQRTRPRLLVQVAPRARKWTYVWEGLLIIVASTCLLLAVVLSAIAVRESLARKRA